MRSSRVCVLGFLVIALLFTVTSGLSTSEAATTGNSYTYKVVKGDCLWLIAQRNGTTVDKLMAANNLKSDLLQIGQVLVVPGKAPSYQPVSRGALTRVIPPPAPAAAGVSANPAALDVDPTEDDDAEVTGGSVETGSNPQPGKAPQLGQLVNWPDANKLFPRGGYATLRDFETGREFKIYRLFGTNHADCEPVTAEDSRIMRECFGGQWSWNRRAAILLIDGQAIACSMAGMPHGTSQNIKNNNFNGHFDLHFLNSRTHATNKVDPAHQAAVRRAAGQ